MVERSEYARITLAAAKALVDEESAAFEIYLPNAEDLSPVLYRKSGAGLSQPDFQRLRSGGVSFLYIRRGDLCKCEAILENKLAALLGRSDIRPMEKAKIVHDVGTAVARDLIGGPLPNSDLSRASSMIHNVIGCILNDPLIAAHMLRLAPHEHDTAGHMFAVSALSIMLGAEIFGPEQHMLSSLGLAGMMHDIGKLAIDPKILNKTSPLTPQEVQLIQQHPVESVRLLGNDPRAAAGVRQMILQHHEWVNGCGYPLGVTGYELFPSSRILSIVNSFHALIGRRACRPAVTPWEANRALTAQAGQQFDREILACWRNLSERCWALIPTGIPPDLEREDEKASSRYGRRPITPRRGTFSPRAKRFACDGRVRVRCVYAGRLTDATCAPNEFVPAVEDVSRGGLCITSAYPMYCGEIVHVQVSQDGPPTWVRGVVAWCRRHKADTYRVGLRFCHRIAEQAVHKQLPVQSTTHVVGALSGAAKPDCRSRRPGGEKGGGPHPESRRESAVKTLEAIAAMPAVNPEDERTAISMSASGDPVVRRKSIDVLAGIGSESARQAIVDLIGDDNISVGEHAIGVAGVLQLVEASGALRRLLKSRTETTAVRAAGALGRLGNKSGLSLVIRMLERDDSIASLAAQAFGDIVGQRFPPNTRGVQAARRYLKTKGDTLVP